MDDRDSTPLREPDSEEAATDVATQQLLVTERMDWLDLGKRLLLCNPFFLCSAALMLYAINRLSNDPAFLPGETQNLLFNFYALQFYEVLLVGTAVLLAFRKIWYDSALLVVLENGMVLIPFMLMSQAALIGSHIAWALTISGILITTTRFLGVRRWYPQFNLPNRALVLGAFILAGNVALPGIVRHWIENDWMVPNLCAWYFVLPLFAAGANLLPRPVQYGGNNAQRHWLPLFIYGLWLTGSAVHVWSAAHICNLRFELHLLGPLALVCGWTIWNRLSDFLRYPPLTLAKTILVLSFIIPLLSFEMSYLFLVLCSVNLVMYFSLGFIGRPGTRKLARGLAVASLPLMLTGLPQEWKELLFPALGRGEGLLLPTVVYFILLALFSRDFRLALLGGILAGIVVGALTNHWSTHASIQACLIYLLLHSVRWGATPALRVTRSLIAGGWILDTIIWTRLGGWQENTFVTGGAVLLILAWCLDWWRNKHRGALLIPNTAILALLCGPSNWFQRNSPEGVIALVASLVLFALGFLLAWTKQHWNGWASHPRRPSDNLG